MKNKAKKATRKTRAGRFVFMTERGAPMPAAGFRKMLARLGQAAIGRAVQLGGLRWRYCRSTAAGFLTKLCDARENQARA